MNCQESLFDDADVDHSWAVALVRNRFSTGLASLTNANFLQRRFEQFKKRNDPIYAELLRSMDDEPLARTFVSYWTIAHTLATESRFWLEEAIADIVIRQHERFGRNEVQVYSQSMLSHGFWERQVAIANLGEDERDNLTKGKPWRCVLKQKALEQIDLRVGREERLVQQKDRGQLNPAERLLLREQAQHRDLMDLNAVGEAVAGDENEQALLHCNLLVVEPDRLRGEPNVWAFRFANPKTLSSHAIRKQERVNLLRLYALLVQEKPLREAGNIRVYMAEVLPRESGRRDLDRYPDYFTDKTYWTSDQMWEYIGVPFSVVSEAIRDVAQQFREQLIDGLRGLLPSNSDAPPATRKD